MVSLFSFPKYYYCSILTNVQALQTPRQRAANAKFASINTKKQGKPRAKAEAVQFPISKGWIFALVFLVCGGAVLELLRLFF